MIFVWACMATLSVNHGPLLRAHAPRRASRAVCNADREHLEQVFSLRTPDWPEWRTAQAEVSAAAASQPGTLQDVPLFRPAWSALPGFTHQIQVDGPDYVHMFEQLVATAAAEGVPAVFGQLLLPSASPSPGPPGLALMPGSRAPKVGVVMEVVSVRRQSDGSLTVVAHGTSRFRLHRMRCSAPYTRADLMLLPDLEEVSEVRDWPDSVELPAHWRAEATRAAAAEVSYMWAQAEAARDRAGGAQALVASADGTGIPDVSGTSGGASESGGAAGSGDSSAGATRGKRHLDHGIGDEQERGSDDLAPFNLRLSIPQIKQEAHAIAKAAAQTVIEQAIAEQPPTAAASPTEEALNAIFGGGVDGIQRSARYPKKEIMRVPRALFSGRGPPAGRAFLLALEQALWTELVNCLRLSHGNAEGLPEPLLVLLPPAPHSGWSVAMPETMASEWLRRWEYPPVRRAQRLSFLMAIMLPNLDRQRLLEASSVRERLQLGVVYLGEMRRRLVATRLIQTVPGLEGGGSAFGV